MLVDRGVNDVWVDDEEEGFYFVSLSECSLVELLPSLSIGWVAPSFSARSLMDGGGGGHLPLNSFHRWLFTAARGHEVCGKDDSSRGKLRWSMYNVHWPCIMTWPCQKSRDASKSAVSISYLLRTSYSLWIVTGLLKFFLIFKNNDVFNLYQKNYFFFLKRTLIIFIYL